MNNTNGKSKKLNELLNWFLNKNFEYALVGEDPIKLLNIFENDVDIAITKNAYLKLNHLIFDLCKDINVKLIILYRHEIDVFDFIVTWEENGIFYNLPIDMCVDYRRKGIKFINSHTLLSTKILDEKTQWFTLSYETNFLYYLIKKTSKQSINDSQISFLHNLYNQSNKEKVKSLVSNYWNRDTQEQIIKIIENKDINSFNRECKNWEKMLIAKCKCSFKEYFIDLKRKFLYIIQPRGLICSLKESDLPFFDEYIKTTSKWFRKNQVIKLKRFTPLTILKILNCKWHSGIVFVVSPNTNRFVFSDISLDATNSSELKPHFEQIINYMEARETKRIRRFIKHLRKE